MRVAGVVPVLTAAAVLEQNIGQERTAFPGTECSIGRDTDGPGQAQTSAQAVTCAPTSTGAGYRGSPLLEPISCGCRSGSGLAFWARRDGLLGLPGQPVDISAHRGCGARAGRWARRGLPCDG